MKEQKKGHVYRRGGWWILRFRQTINQGGELKIRHRAEKLAPYGPHYKTERSVQELVKERLKEINNQNREPATVVTILDFVERIYLPYVAAQKRPSTSQTYHAIWQGRLRSLIGSVLLRQVRTMHVQRWLETIASRNRTQDGKRLGHYTLKHIKTLISGIFSYAKQQGFYDAVNPVQSTSLPPAPHGDEPHAYSLEEITSILAALPEPAATVFATAAFTGLRRGEIKGLLWENYQNGELHISRSIWNGHITAPKTVKSAAAVPVIKQLRERLEMHRERLGNPISGPVFQNQLGGPLDLNNLLRRVILPVLRRDSGLPKWQGWHAARRGLGSNLYRLGVPELVIQRILRHSNVATTTAYYIKTSTADVRKAMMVIEENIPASPALCADCAPEEASEASTGLVN